MTKCTFLLLTVHAGHLRRSGEFRWPRIHRRHRVTRLNERRSGNETLFLLVSVDKIRSRYALYIYVIVIIQFMELYRESNLKLRTHSSLNCTTRCLIAKRASDVKTQTRLRQTNRNGGRFDAFFILSEMKRIKHFYEKKPSPTFPLFLSQRAKCCLSLAGFQKHAIYLYTSRASLLSISCIIKKVRI